MYVLSVLAALIAGVAFPGDAFPRLRPAPTSWRCPPTGAPCWGVVWSTVWSRVKVFITEAGTIILAFSIILWALAYFPRSDAIESQAAARVAAGEDEAEVANWAAGEQLEQSYMGRMGHAIEPVIEPLGFNWKVGGRPRGFVRCPRSARLHLGHCVQRRRGRGRDLVVLARQTAQRHAE